MKPSSGTESRSAILKQLCIVGEDELLYHYTETRAKFHESFLNGFRGETDGYQVSVSNLPDIKRLSDEWQKNIKSTIFQAGFDFSSGKQNHTEQRKQFRFTGGILELVETASKQGNPFGESGELCPKSESVTDDLSGRRSLQFKT